MSSAEINLLKRDVSSSRSFSLLEDRLRIAAWWSLVALFATGIVIGTLFFYLNSRSEQLNQQNTQLGQQINTQLVKEGILASLKSRADIARKALDVARPWGNLFPILTQIASQNQLLSLTVDETARVNIVLKLGSVDDAVNIVDNVIALAGQNTLHSPQLLSFTIKDDGSVQMGLSFVPVLL
jgi:hypothetical protein